MSDPEPIPVQAPQIQQPPKRKWYQMKPSTKQKLNDVKYLIGTFIVLCLTQILQPILIEIMESNMKTLWKTYATIIIPAGLTVLIAIIMKVVQGEEPQYEQQQRINQYQQMPGQYIQQGATMGTNLINTGATQLNQAIAPIVQPSPVATPIATTETKVEPTT